MRPLNYPSVEVFGLPAITCSSRPTSATTARDAGQQHDDADAGPYDRFPGRAVRDEGLRRPVLRVRNVFAGPVRGRGPGGPEKERRESAQAVRIRDGAGRDRV